MRFAFPGRRRAREEALAWLARLRRGLRESEGRELVSWLRRPGHRTLIARAAADWHGPDVLAVLAALFPIDPRMLETRPRRKRAEHLAVVLVCALLTLAPLFAIRHYLPGLLEFQPREPGLIEALGDSFATDPGARRGLLMQDGSRIVLGGDTRLSVLYSEHLRAVLLSQGKATFSVVGQLARPFHVRAAGHEFDSNAATFAVRLRAPRHIDLFVLHGTVQAYPTPAAALEGEMARYAVSRRFERCMVGPGQVLEIGPDEQSARQLTPEDVRMSFQ
ncbi:MAG TPA: FecR domain-containing protein [Steroidobacteraceae bacterium]|nr:FecR domain-containing protein [Steroidobacteraceae bacterium]